MSENLQPKNEEDLAEFIEGKAWAADGLLTRARILVDRSRSLDPSARRSVPRYVGDWTEQSVTEFFGRFEESIRNPIRRKNKATLEEIGVPPKGVSEETFDETIRIIEIVSLLKELRQYDSIFKFVVGKDVIADWMRQGLDVAKQRLEQVLDAQQPLSNLAGVEIRKELADELLARSISNLGYVEEAQKVASILVFISVHGVTMPERWTFDELVSKAQSISEGSNSLIGDFGATDQDVKEILSGKGIDAALKEITSRLDDARAVKARLHDEWTTLIETLTGMGEVAPTEPTTIAELRKEIEVLRKKCIDSLGDDGMAVLSYLKGEGNFPEVTNYDGLRQALERVRPLVKKAFEESADA